MWKSQRFLKFLNPYDQTIDIDHFAKYVKNASKILADVSFNETHNKKKEKRFLGAEKQFILLRWARHIRCDSYERDQCTNQYDLNALNLHDYRGRAKA